MPLIEKGILVEGPNGETLVRKYYVQEKQENPYGDRGGVPVNPKAYLYDKKAQRFIRRKHAPDEKGYTWQMGYNNCVGNYSTPGTYSRFRGSSLNRDKSLIYEKKLEEGEGDSITLAYKAARQYYIRGIELPGRLRDYLVQQKEETERGFRDWLRTAHGWETDGISFPIYKLSARSRGKIKDKATAFFRACPGERVFCTLTFIAPVDDGSGVSILNKFLTVLRKEFAGLQYLWVAERQENGNIHFHIILNKRLPIRKYNAMWVMQQYRAGLRGQTKYGETVSMAQVEDYYKRGTIHRVFNPVDVKRVRSIASLSSYLTKYITKQKQDTLFACSPWHCSRGVSRLFTRAVVGPSAFAYMMSLNNCKVDKSTGEVFMPVSVRPKGPGADFCIIVYVNKKDSPLRYLREMEQINKWLIKGLLVTGRLDDMDDERYRKLLCKN